MPTHLAGSLTGAYGRLLIFWVLLCLALPLSADLCRTPDGLPEAEVRRVVDGDTLLLTDGTRVRMVGLDAPEHGRNGAADEPFARDATQHLSTLIRLAGQRIRLQVGPEPRDRYGRMLAVVHTDRHGNLAAHLLRQGFALVAIVPPNLIALDCHTAAETEARSGQKGLWGLGSGPVIAADDLKDTGFAILRGRASSWTERREDRFLTLNDAVVLRFRRADLERWFLNMDLDTLADATLEVRGWVHPWGSGQKAITVQHPSTIEVLQD